MVLINLKLKTLDSNQDRIISIDDQNKLLDFREEVERVVSVPKEQQRLIFRGRVLSDDTKTLQSYGLEDDMAVHLVTRPPEAERQRARIHSTMGAEDAEGGGQGMPRFRGMHERLIRGGEQPIQNAAVAAVINSNLLIGNVPLERTNLFAQPDDILQLVTSMTEQLQTGFHLNVVPTLALNRPNNDDFSINIILRGIRDERVNSPARERFEHLLVEIRRLAWNVSIIRAVFDATLDALFDSGNEPSQEEAYRNIANILRSMYHLDYMDEVSMRQLPNQDPELLELIEQLGNMNLESDAAHEIRVNTHAIMRHCTAQDFSRLLQLLSSVDAHINAHIMPRYYRALVFPGDANRPSSAYIARLLNCFSTAFSRMQHQRSHIYHVISDFSIHADSNEQQRMYPQYLVYNRHDEPPIADLSLLFYHPRNSDRSHGIMSMNSPNVGPNEIFANRFGQQRQANATARAPVVQGHFMTITLRGEDGEHITMTASSRPDQEPMDHQDSGGGGQESAPNSTQGQTTETGRENSDSNRAPPDPPNNAQSSSSTSATAGSQSQQAAPAQSMLQSFFTNLMQSVGTSILGGGVNSTPMSSSTFSTTQQPPSSTVNQQQQQTNNQSSSSSTTTNASTNTTIANSNANSTSLFGGSSISSRGVPTDFGGITRGPPPTGSTRVILRPIRQMPTRQSQQQNTGTQTSGIHRYIAPIGTRVTIGRVPSSGSISTTTTGSGNQTAANQQQIGGRRGRRNSSREGNNHPGFGTRPRSATPIPHHHHHNVRDGLGDTFQMSWTSQGGEAGRRGGSHGLFFPPNLSGRGIGGGGGRTNWSQISPSTDSALFVGPNPPSNFPMYTHDPYLYCSSRRWRIFELDARHGDFWNDPITVSLGLEPPQNSMAAVFARNEADSDGEHPNPQNQNQSGEQGNNTNPNSPNLFGGTGINGSGFLMPVRANNNGEFVFTERDSFSQFVRQTLETIAQCMADIDHSISVDRRRARQERPLFNAGSTVYGFTPMNSVNTLQGAFGVAYPIGGGVGFSTAPAPPVGGPQNAANLPQSGAPDALGMLQILNHLSQLQQQQPQQNSGGVGNAAPNPVPTAGGVVEGSGQNQNQARTDSTSTSATSTTSAPRQWSFEADGIRVRGGSTSSGINAAATAPQLNDSFVSSTTEGGGGESSASGVPDGMVDEPME